MLFLQLLYYLVHVFMQLNIAMDVVIFLLIVPELEHQIYHFQGISPLSVLFLLATLTFFILSLCANSSKPWVSLLITILSYVFMVFSFTKFIAVCAVFSGSFQDESHPLILLALLSFLYLPLTFLALILLKFEEVLCNLHKYFLGYVAYVLESYTFFYMVRIYMVCNLHDVTWGSRGISQNRPHHITRKYLCRNVIILCLWILLQVAIAAITVWAPFRYAFLVLLTVLVLLFNTVRIVEALVFVYCRYHCSWKK